MPPGNQWSADEVTIAVYFSSRQICCKAVRFLLLRRGYDRSVPAIERKLLSISQQHPDLRTSEGNWELNVADSWIDAVLGDHESVNQLIRFSLADAEDVIAVCFRLGLLWPYFTLTTLLTQSRINEPLTF